MIFVECRRDACLVAGAILTLTRHRWHNLIDRQLAKGFIGPLAVCPFVADGLGPALAEEARARVVDACVTVAQEAQCDSLLLSDTPQSRQCLDDRPIVNRHVISANWRPELAYHYVLDLSQTNETLWKNLETRCRTSIRRARERVQVLTADNVPNAREQHINLLNVVSTREGRVLLEQAQFLRVWNYLYDGHRGQAFFCVEGAKVWTFTGVARFGSVASYQHAGRAENEPTGAAALGVWAAIEWAKSVGCRWFDCNGAVLERVGRERQRAISRFKRGFGGKLFQVHGARQNLRPLAQATFDFIDAWGAEAKRLVRRVVNRPFL